MSAESDLKEQVKTEFQKVVAKDFRGNNSAAARDLDLSPQRFDDYVRGKIAPPAHVLALACERWGIEFRISGVRIGTEELREPSVTSTVRRKDSQSIEITLDIDLND